MKTRWNYLGISLATLAVDQATKLAIAARFSEETIIPVIPGLFRLVRVENTGIAFGILASSSSAVTGAILVLVSLGAIALVGLLLWHNPPAATRAGMGLALILGGAVGNLIDRLARGAVIDFLDVYVGSYHWPAFNIADSAITIGAAALLWDLLIAHPARSSTA